VGFSKESGDEIFDSETPEIIWLSYGECFEGIEALGSAFRSLGSQLVPGDCIGILSANRYLFYLSFFCIYFLFACLFSNPCSFFSWEYLVTILAALYQGQAYAPLPEMFTVEQLKYFIDHLSIR
jgi:acyl-CoA synthetase (AMP-forming)/AMP-acid ligase II